MMNVNGGLGPGSSSSLSLPPSLAEVFSHKQNEVEQQHLQNTNIQPPLSPNSLTEQEKSLSLLAGQSESQLNQNHDSNFPLSLTPSLNGVPPSRTSPPPPSSTPL